ncbi:MAG: DUF2785 domain-containing protein [Anaerolineales bacterium]
MDKLFWKTIQENDYAIPADHTPTSLTSELFLYLGSANPELRDEIAYDIFVNFLERDYYNLEEIEIYIANLLANLETGIGEMESDSVFLRSFSALFLAEIVYNDNKVPRLKDTILKTILEKGLWYLAAERDPRGYVKEKGWAHALAHTADLLLVLGKSMKTGKRDHQMILNDIRAKLIQSTDWVYIHGEDDRLSRAALESLLRGSLSETFLKEWLQTFLEPDDGTWKGAWTKDASTRAFSNVRNFLRSLFLQIVTKENLENRDQYKEVVLETIQALRTY